MIERGAKHRKGQSASALMQEAEQHRHDGKLKSAERCYRRILEHDASHVGALGAQARLLLETNRPREAIPLLLLLLDQAPNSVEGNLDMGLALEGISEGTAAIDYYHKVLVIDPNHAIAYNNIGNVFYRLGDSARALPWFAKAIELAPLYAQAHANLGVALLEHGFVDKAVMAYERAIELDPANAQFYRLLAEARPITRESQHFPALLALARDRRRLPTDQRIEVNFACANVYEHVGDFRRAYKHMVEGNKLKRRGIVYDEANMLAIMQHIESVFTPDLMQAGRGCGHDTPAPIFVIGMPRSGSTLIEQILAAHPDVASLGEDGALGGFIDEAGPTTPPFPDWIETMSVTAIPAIGASYLDHMTLKAPGAKRVINKMLGNFTLLGLLHLVFPNARFIHTRRDPLDNCLSCYARLFTESFEFTFDLQEIARFYRAYETLMAHWRRLLPSGVMIDIQYEEFVADSERQTRRLLAHCGLDWHEDCRNFWRSNRAIRTASVAQVRRPIYQNALKRAEHYVEARAILQEALALSP
ncbi:MAG TPA: sulfotransferase [Stellaceae bacterium]|nr:sulfotransferase [Stellaceae bacterium]